jgi:hypothetical protein
MAPTVEVGGTSFSKGRGASPNQSGVLTQAVGIMATNQLGKSLTDADVAKIVAFLKSKTGEQPQVTYPILPPKRGEYTSLQ